MNSLVEQKPAQQNPRALTPSTAPVPAVTPMDMLARAMERGISTEQLEKLLQLQEKWEQNEARKAFGKAIAAAKAEIPPIIKNREASFGPGRAAYQYEDLAEIDSVITPILGKHGMSFRFRTEVVGKDIVVTCRVSHEMGHYEETSLPAPPDLTGGKNPIHALGSTVTYLQRYTLKAALGLTAARDDDGHGGEAPKPTKPAPAKRVSIYHPARPADQPPPDHAQDTAAPATQPQPPQDAGAADKPADAVDFDQPTDLDQKAIEAGRVTLEQALDADKNMILAAHKGSAALRKAWVQLPPPLQHTLLSALETRYKKAAFQADIAEVDRKAAAARGQQPRGKLTPPI